MTSRRPPCTVEVSDLAPASPAQVWATIADPRSFAAWASGTRVIRDADPAWPAPGSALHRFRRLARGIQLWRNRRSLAALCRLSRDRDVR